MTRPRVRLASAVSGLALAAVVGLVPASPATAEPEIGDVKDRVDTLYHQAEQAQERWHDAKIQLDSLKGDLTSLRADQRRAARSLDTVRDEARQAILSQYTGSDLGAIGSVVAAGDPSSFLDEVSTMSSFQELQQDVFDDYDTSLEALQLREQATAKRVGQVASLEERLSEEKDTVDEKLADAKELLGRLEEEERREMLARGSTTSTRLPSSVPASGRAAAAVQYAMSQVGDAYVYGAAGPSAWDCSGLTMMAWAQAGVALPHSSSAQFGTGTRVSTDQLQPGDLVFYYSPISHVAMYIGNGMIVHAANPGAGVKVSPLNEMPYVGAVRPG